MEKSRKTTTKSDPSTGHQLSKRRAETWPGRVTPKPGRVPICFPAAGRMPKPGPVVCGPGSLGPRRAVRVPKPGRAPVTARRGPGPALPGGQAGGGTPLAQTERREQTDSTTVTITLRRSPNVTCACRCLKRMTDRE